MDTYIDVSEAIGRVSAIWSRDEGSHAVLVLAHGAGAGMRHAFMEALASALAKRGIATLRYQFPYMEKGSRRPDAKKTLLSTVRAAVDFAESEAPDLLVVAGGKSMGGRMTSQAAAEEPLPGVRGLVFVGFPLHPAGKPGTERGAHLSDVEIPMLFLQGTRDALADLDLLRPVLAKINEQKPRATLNILDGADHGFHVLKRSGRTAEEVMEELAESLAKWVAEL